MNTPIAAAILAHFELPTGASARADAAPIIDSFNPADGTLLARVPAMDLVTYEERLHRAVSAAHAWRDAPAPHRGELVRLLAEELRRNRQELGQLVSLENGKILAEGVAEVQDMIDMADLAVGQSRMLHGRTMHSERPHQRLYEQWHPLGVVAVITAFNFPVGVWAWNALLAAVCGNTVVWKPSPKTPLCALAVQRLCERVLRRHGLPPVFQLLQDAGTTVAGRLADDPRVALLSFTGSTPVGRQLGTRVATRLGRNLLELGGNGAVIVDETADLALATRAIVSGALGTAGQRCTSTRRVLVQRSQFVALRQRLVHAYQQVRIGSPLDPGVMMGPLIDAAAVQTFQQVIRTALDAGGELLTGGTVLQRPGHFVEPAIIVARNEWPIVQQESFVPVLYLIVVDSLAEAIHLQNQSAHGLSSALFTQRLQHAEQFLSARGSDCGIANINTGTSGVEIGGAFGGEKDTGGGREAGSDAWKTYMRRQTNTINWSTSLPLGQDIGADSASGHQ